MFKRLPELPYMAIVCFICTIVGVALIIMAIGLTSCTSTTVTYFIRANITLWITQNITASVFVQKILQIQS